MQVKKIDCPREIKPYDNDHCPKCGAGQNSDGTFTLPKNWPINTKCGECDRRAKKRMYELGASWARQRNQEIFEILISEVNQR